MMDIDKLIEALRGKCEVCKRESCRGNYWSLLKCPATLEAATALSALQDENEKLRAELKKAEMELDSLLAEGETVAFDPFGAEKED